MAAKGALSIAYMKDKHGNELDEIKIHHLKQITVSDDQDYKHHMLYELESGETIFIAFHEKGISVATDNKNNVVLKTQ